jgi:uncharacterized protein YjbI with pentapeptide repeats
MSPDPSINVTALRGRWDTPQGHEVLLMLLKHRAAGEAAGGGAGQFNGSGNTLINSQTYAGSGDFIDFRGVDLSHRNLTALEFSDEFSFADFSGSILDGALFSAGKFYFANFEGAQAVHTRPQFAPVYAQGANFRNVRFKGALFLQADLRGADFSGAVLEDCEFSGSLLQDAVFDGTRMINCAAGSMHLLAREKTAAWFQNSTFTRNYIVWD